MQIKNGKDFWAGVMFMAFGIGFLIVARNYNMGTSVRMGPAYFPTMLGGLLAVLGASIFARSFFSKIEYTVRVFAFRPLVLLAGIGIALVAWYAKGSGAFLYNLLVAISLIVMTAAWGPKALFVILSSVIIFAYLLKPLGLVISTVVLITLASWGGGDFRGKEVLISVIVLCVFAVVVFVWSLGLPFPVCPEALDDQCRAIGLTR